MLDYHSDLAHYDVRPTTYARAMCEGRANFERGIDIGSLGHRLVPASLSWRADSLLEIF